MLSLWYGLNQGYGVIILQSVQLGFSLSLVNMMKTRAGADEDFIVYHHYVLHRTNSEIRDTSEALEKF